MLRHRGMTFRRFISAVGDALLKQYFNKIGHSISDNINLEAELERGYLSQVPEEKRSVMIEHFKCINDVTERGMAYMEKAVMEDGVSVPENAPVERTAMWLFLEHNNTFKKAHDRYLCLTIGADLTLYKLPGDNPDFNQTKLTLLKDDIAAYYQKKSKGKGCIIRNYDEDGKRYILIERGDYMKSDMRWLDSENKNELISYRPGREDVLVYNPAKKVLGVRITGKGDEPKQKYVELFARHILGQETIPKTVFTTSLVSLKPFQKESFDYNGNEVIKEIKLILLNGTINGMTLIKIGLKSPDLVKSLQDDLDIYMGDIDLNSVELQFKLVINGLPLKPIPIGITSNSKASLDKKREYQIIEDYLRKQGVIIDQ